MDDEVLDMEIIRSLRQQAPTNDDITALKEFDGDHSKLGKVFAACCYRLILMCITIGNSDVGGIAVCFIRTGAAMRCSWLGLAGLGWAGLDWTYGTLIPPLLVCVYIYIYSSIHDTYCIVFHVVVVYVMVSSFFFFVFVSCIFPPQHFVLLFLCVLSLIFVAVAVVVVLFFVTIQCNYDHKNFYYGGP